MTLKNKINLLLATFLLLGVFLLMFLIRPVYKDIQEGSRELISKKQELVSLENKIKNIEEFRKNYREIKENLEKAKTLFIKPAAPVDFISFLEESSQDTQIAIDISPSSARKEKGDIWPSMAFQIRSVCSFPRCFRFLEKLELSPYLIKIRNLNITRLTEQELRSKGFEEFSLGATKINLSLKVFAK